MSAASLVAEITGLAQRLGRLEDEHGSVVERIARGEANDENFTRWQEAQNGSIHRIAERLDKLIFLMLGTLASSVVALLLELLRGFAR